MAGMVINVNRDVIHALDVYKIQGYVENVQQKSMAHYVNITAATNACLQKMDIKVVISIPLHVLLWHVSRDIMVLTVKLDVIPTANLGLMARFYVTLLVEDVHLTARICSLEISVSVHVTPTATTKHVIEILAAVLTVSLTLDLQTVQMQVFILTDTLLYRKSNI